MNEVAGRQFFKKSREQTFNSLKSQKRTTNIIARFAARNCVWAWRKMNFSGFDNTKKEIILRGFDSETNNASHSVLYSKNLCSVFINLYHPRMSFYGFALVGEVLEGKGLIEVGDVVHIDRKIQRPPSHASVGLILNSPILWTDNVLWGGPVGVINL